MARRDVRVVRDEAARAAAEGKHKRAIECYLELEALEPSEPNWPKRAAETYRRLDRQREAVAAYERAIERYVQGGFLVQAIAVCKVILSLEPGHDSAKMRLASMSEQQDASRSQAGALADRHTSLHGLPVVEMLRGTGGTEAPPTRGRASEPPPSRGRGSDPPPARGRGSDPPPARTRSTTLPPSVSFARPIETPPPAEPEPEPELAGEFTLDGGDEDLVVERRERSSGSITIDRGAPLDSVDLASAMGAEPSVDERGESSGIIVIPIDEEPSGDAPALEIHAVTVEGDDAEAAIEISHDEPPEELSLDDLEEVPLLAEPKAYSAAARKALTATPLFASLSAGALESMIDHLALVDLVAGDTLFRQGDAGTTLYVVVDGEVAVISEGPPRIEVSRLGPGAFFGEVALVTEQPRSATIEATTTTQLLAIDRDVIGALVADHAEVLPVILRFLRERLVDRLVQTHPLFAPFADADRRDLIARWKFLEIEPGTTITAAGTKAPGLYALLAGQVDVLADGAPVAALGPGEMFGETSLLTGQPDRVTVRSRAKCLALCLPAADFREVIMTHPQVLSYIGELVEERERVLAPRMSASTRAKMV
ncbi:MAG: cyclic nucleotide-binding domain-containing protein [Myxococcales bacterium]|nr:cyclic nucleotide-binding domain-containing protein [Myxococcales bacterium]